MAVSSMSCTSQTASSPELDPSAEIVTSALRAPRPKSAPEQLSDRPQFRLRDSDGVRRALTLFLGARRSTIQQAFDRLPKYQPIFERIFADNGVPAELSTVAIIESLLDETAKSPSGAVGLWQFMPDTAKRFGLKVSYFKDERIDVEKSTVAAARYLAELHEQFDDWLLAVAAYNCGPARLEEAIVAAKSRDFFDIAAADVLSKQTVQFVERFVALGLVLRNREAYGF